jgi:nitrite reductase (NAD(P)H)
MPLIDSSRNDDAVHSSISNGISHATVVESVRDLDYRHNDPNRRQKIVVVGLGMVAISFMYVASSMDKDRSREGLPTNYRYHRIVRKSSSKMQRGASTILL